MTNLLSELEAVVGLRRECCRAAKLSHEEWVAADELSTNAMALFIDAHHAEIAAAVRDAERLEVVEDRLLTLVNAIKRAGGDPRQWADWTPSEREAIDAALTQEAKTHD